MIIKTPAIENMNGAFDVRGQNVVVTGGNRGIGLGITRAYAQSGANVVILCRDTERGKKAVEEIKKFGGKYACFGCDVASLDSVKTATTQVFEFFDNVDILINNAGVSSTLEFLNDKDLSEWYRVIDTDLHGAAHIVYMFAPKMRESGQGGSIINISSVGGQSVSNSRHFHHPPYNVAKAGLDIFTRYLAINLGNYGIRVNSIAPGATHSDLDHDLPPAAIKHVEKELPTHRFGEPIEIGALCVFLSSPAASQITGTIIPHDGGLLCIE